MILLCGRERAFSASFVVGPTRSRPGGARTTTSSSSSSFARKDDPTWFEERRSYDDDDDEEDGGVRWLGKGASAPVRPGAVLIAPEHEHNHWLRRAAVFVYAVGRDGSGGRAVRGVVLDHPTAFTVGEMTTPGTVVGAPASNLLFRGGDRGGDGVVLLHDADDAGRPVGDAGVREGGLDDVRRLVDEGLLDADRLKFFFNYVELNDNELRSLLGQTDADGDAWISAEVPIDLVLDSDLDQGDAWRALRRILKNSAAENVDDGHWR